MKGPFNIRLEQVLEGLTRAVEIEFALPTKALAPVGKFGRYSRARRHKMDIRHRIRSRVCIHAHPREDIARTMLTFVVRNAIAANQKEVAKLLGRSDADVSRRIAEARQLLANDEDFGRRYDAIRQRTRSLKWYVMLTSGNRLIDHGWAEKMRLALERLERMELPEGAKKTVTEALVPLWEACDPLEELPSPWKGEAPPPFYPEGENQPLEVLR